jgi:hypothetical protein
MNATVAAVKSKEMGYLKAAKTRGVPRGSLGRYVKQYEDGEVKALRQKPVFRFELERDLI